MLSRGLKIISVYSKKRILYKMYILGLVLVVTSNGLQYG